MFFSKKDFFRHTINTILIACLIICDPRTAFAITDTGYEFRAINDQLWYEYCTPSGSTSSSSSGSEALTGGDNAEKVWNFLKSKGFSDEQTAGIMGNLAHEAGDPTLNKTDAEEIGGGGGFGLAQWTGSRRTEIHSVAREQGRDVNDLQFQLEYLYQEMQTRTERDGGSKTEEQGMKEQQTVEEAVYYFMYNYERPGVDHEDKRLAYAKEYLVRFGGTGGSTSSGGGGNECDESGSGGMLNAQCGEGGFIGTLRCYAWPEYRGLDVTPTEEYREHVIVPGTTPSKGESDIYIGGLSHDGIDCGGFVTRLIIDSGFDPEYNYGGLKSRGGGPTGNQMAWAKANWTTLGQGNEINVADLRPGDVAISGSHTFVFIGPVEGFEPTNIASASLDERAPMAGNESITDSSMTWFGKR